MNLQEFQARAETGLIFGVTFVKRTTGETRDMVCRLGVTRHLAGGKLAYEPGEKSLLPVYDMQAAGYRMVPLDGLQTLRMAGASYRWDAATAAFVLDA